MLAPHHRSRKLPPRCLREKRPTDSHCIITRARLYQHADDGGGSRQQQRADFGRLTVTVTLRVDSRCSETQKGLAPAEHVHAALDRQRAARRAVLAGLQQHRAGLGAAVHRGLHVLPWPETHADEEAPRRRLQHLSHACMPQREGRGRPSASSSESESGVTAQVETASPAPRRWADRAAGTPAAPPPRRPAGCGRASPDVRRERSSTCTVRRARAADAPVRNGRKRRKRRKRRNPRRSGGCRGAGCGRGGCCPPRRGAPGVPATQAQIADPQALTRVRHSIGALADRPCRLVRWDPRSWTPRPGGPIRGAPFENDGSLERCMAMAHLRVSKLILFLNYFRRNFNYKWP